MSLTFFFMHISKMSHVNCTFLFGVVYRLVRLNKDVATVFGDQDTGLPFLTINFTCQVEIGRLSIDRFQV